MSFLDLYRKHRLLLDENRRLRRKLAELTRVFFVWVDTCAPRDFRNRYLDTIESLNEDYYECVYGEEEDDTDSV